MKNEKWKMKNGKCLDLLILAGGYGSRLRKVIGDHAKVLAPVRGRPLLARLLDHFHARGVTRVVLALGVHAGEVLAWLGGVSRPGIEIVPIVERRPLGTGGAIRHALSRIRTDPFLVANGDTLVAARPAPIIAFHHDRRAAVTIAASRVADASRFGALEIARGGAVTGFIEKGRRGPGRVNAGLYVVSRRAAADLPRDRVISWEREVLPALIGQGLFAFRSRAGFLDIGEGEGVDVERARRRAMKVNRR
jgi:NDP-sugar pyrophosphorylase family protein